MAVSVKFVPPRVALTDPRTGLISREWYRFFADAFSGGVDSAAIIDDFGVEPFAAGSDAVAAVYALGYETGQQQVVGDLDARVAELEKAIASLRIGQVVL